MLVEGHDGGAAAGHRDLKNHVIIRVAQERTPDVVDLVRNTYISITI